MNLEPWKTAWRAGVAALSTPGLIALRAALVSYDARLLQGGTTTPPPMQAVQDWPVSQACALGLCGWLGDGLQTVAEVDEYFARICSVIDNELCESGACRHFVSWFDEQPLNDVVRDLVPEIDIALAGREVAT